jgi:glucosamine--fructose-6-phosphate aminotransferase (isomerizing)
VFLDEMKNITEADFKRFTSIKIAACGTSWHAGLAGKYMIEQLARIPVDVDYASEFRYRDPVMDENTLLLVISQSGETADTIAALREAKELGAKVLAICNVQGSMITREADGTILTHAGPEIGVASTKAFTSQMIALYLLGLYLGNCAARLSEDEARIFTRRNSPSCRSNSSTCSTSQTISRSSRKSSSARLTFSISAAASIFRSRSKAR